MSGLLAVSHFLISLFFSLILFVLWARLALRYLKVSSLHPICQIINRFTDPLTTPIARLLPLDKKVLQRYDWACFSLIIILEFIKFIALSLLRYKTMMPLSYLLLFVLTDLIVQPCNLLFYIILIRVIMSWVNPSWQNPVADVMKRITDPLLKLGRHLIPDIFGFDFSPFIILIILKIIVLFMSASLPFSLI